MQSKHARPYFQGSFEEFVARKSGIEVPLDAWNKSQAEKVRRDQQTYDVADKLELAGVSAYTDTDLTIVGLNTGMHRKVDSFRNITFLPAVAKMRRAPELKFVKYALEDYPMARNWTITSGPRVIIPKRKTTEVGELGGMIAQLSEADHHAGIELAKEKFKQMTRRVSRLNNENFMKDCGAEFTYWAKEFGEVKEDDQGISIHPHLHAVLIMKNGMIQRHRWIQLLQRIRGYLGAHSLDCGIIREPREYVKYCVKPNDLTKLTPFGCATLYSVHRGMRMNQALGEFRKIKRTLKDNENVLTYLDGKLVTMRRPKRTGLSEKDKPWQPPCEFRDHAEPQVVAKIEPAPVFCPITEPLVLVHGLGGRDVLKWVIETDDIQDYIARINVHTKSLIVRKNGENEKEKEWIRTKSKPKLYYEDAVAN